MVSWGGQHSIHFHFHHQFPQPRVLSGAEKIQQEGTPTLTGAVAGAGHSEAILSAPCNPTCPLHHCPTEQPSGLFPLHQKRNPSLRLQGGVSHIPLCPIPSSRSAPSDSPAGGAPPTPSPDETSFKRPSPSPDPTASLVHLPFFQDLSLPELLISCHFILLHLPPPKRSSRKPGSFAGCICTASSKPTGQVLRKTIAN